MYHYLLENSRADRLLRSLGLERDDFHRFRDAFEDGEQVVVRTQGGGRERECFCAYFGEDADRPIHLENRFHDKRCPKVYSNKLTTHSAFISDTDDSSDSRFALIRFKKPRR